MPSEDLQAALAFLNRQLDGWTLPTQRWDLQWSRLLPLMQKDPRDPRLLAAGAFWGQVGESISSGSWSDAMGQTRPVYGFFMLQVLLKLRENLESTGLGCQGLEEKLRQELLEPPRHGSKPGEKLWWSWLQCLGGAALSPAIAQAGLQAAAELLDPLDGPLHRPDPEASLDEWVYDELTSLHAATHLAGMFGRWDQSLQRWVNYHVESTQPDNTTHQPWALGAFLRWDTSGLFALQQLHDASTRPSGLTHALLADAQSQ